MRLWIAGGCGECGRSCFLLEGEKENMMVDCGVMAGVQDPQPHLTREQISRTRYALLTHSHGDHAGAAEWLVKQGFQGTFVMTAETARQLTFPLTKSLLLLTPEKVESLKLGDAKLRYGMSGHCAGAVWYWLSWEGKRVFFSGDYNFYSDVYECAMVQDRKADAALIDSSYPEDEQSLTRFAAKLTAVLKTSGHVLLPVPKHGRGLEILLLLMRRFPQVNVTLDSWMQSELKGLKSIKKWLRPDAYEELRGWKPAHGKSDRHVLLVADAQLSSTLGRYTATIYAQEQYPILLSGTVEEGSFARTLLDGGKAECCVMPVHNSDAECRMMKRANRFDKIVPLYTARLSTLPEMTL